MIQSRDNYIVYYSCLLLFDYSIIFTPTQLAGSFTRHPQIFSILLQNLIFKLIFPGEDYLE